MGQWFYESFLTPRRVPYTLVVLAMIYIWVNPGFLRAFVWNLERELMPVVGGLLQLAICVGIIAFIWKKITR